MGNNQIYNGFIELYSKHSKKAYTIQGKVFRKIVL